MTLFGVTDPNMLLMISMEKKLIYLKNIPKCFELKYKYWFQFISSSTENSNNNKKTPVESRSANETNNRCFFMNNVTKMKRDTHLFKCIHFKHMWNNAGSYSTLVYMLRCSKVYAGVKIARGIKSISVDVYCEMGMKCVVEWV